MMADYRIDVEERYRSRQSVALIGTAAGTYVGGGQPGPRGHWAVPAAWRAVVKRGRVAEWQVFVNPEPIRAVMGSRTTLEG